MIAMFVLISSLWVSIPRDAYGVPHIRASSSREAWYRAGYAVAEDRMWQMELSRHLAEGTLAKILGPSAEASDREVQKTGYTPQELRTQVQHLSLSTRLAMQTYAEGISAFLKHGELPSNYQKFGLKPEPWSVVDSAAISVRLFGFFGSGGASELRNLAALAYLKSQPRIRDRFLDVFDDLTWQNDLRSICTIADSDCPVKPISIFPTFDRHTTEAQLKACPAPTFTELLGAIGLAEYRESRELAEALNLPFRTGSYAAVVSRFRSTTGHPLLLSGPQMGHQAPSPLHEMSIECPEFAVSGADVPGMPGVVIGQTKSFAWGLTSGESDTVDIFWNRTQMGRRPVWRAGNQQRTRYGPVVLESKTAGAIFSLKRAYENCELRSLDALIATYPAKTASEIDRKIARASMNFNYFFATSQGDIGYRCLGKMPVRVNGIDPRLPVPGDGAHDWKGFLTSDQMPHVINPKSGLFLNWNNKPASWWPNGDEPLWGVAFPAESLRAQLSKAKLGLSDLEHATTQIARLDETFPWFQKEYKQFCNLVGVPDEFDGIQRQGSPAALKYRAFLSSLARHSVGKWTGSFISSEIFDRIVQPTVLRNALDHRTKFPFVSDTAALLEEVALDKKSYSLRPFTPGLIKYLGHEPIPFSNRGTYIQVLEIRPQGPKGKNVLPPGESEWGTHASDQVELARGWKYKRMGFGSR